LTVRLQAPERIGALDVEARLAELERSGVDVLPLTGAPKVPLPEPVIGAAQRALFDSNVRVPSRGLTKLREALAARLSEEWSRPIDPDAQILVTNGAMQALHVVFHALLPRGAHVLVPTPAFFFSGLLASAGLRPDYLPGRLEEGWSWDLPGMAAAIHPGTQAILLCSPGNPTGHVPGEEQVLAVADLAARNGLLLIVDESYERFVYDRPRLPSFGRLSSWPETVVVRSMSKSYAISSWRVGFVVAPPRLLEACLRVLEWDSIRCSYLSQVVAAEAVGGDQGWMEACVEQYRRNRDLAMEQVPPPLRAARPAGAAFLFVDLRAGYGLEGDAAADSLLQTGVPLVPGRHFMAPGFVRIPIGGTVDDIRSLGARLVAWLASRSAVVS
jgi:aminotransferase